MLETILSYGFLCFPIINEKIGHLLMYVLQNVLGNKMPWQKSQSIFKASFATDVQSSVNNWAPKHKVSLAAWYLGYSPEKADG